MRLETDASGEVIQFTSGGMPWKVSGWGVYTWHTATISYYFLLLPIASYVSYCLLPVCRRPMYTPRDINFRCLLLSPTVSRFLPPV